eukprot:m.10249 g.10249  ORF g.10249 m.10249 type:complete len:641 (-) comp8205_c0_seq1:22-1944(-)
MFFTIVCFAAFATRTCVGFETSLESPTLPDISFATANWHFDPGVTVNPAGVNTTICIKGSPTTYTKATLTLPATAVGGNMFFFVADVQLTGVVLGSAAFMAPKLKISGDASCKTYLAENLDLNSTHGSFILFGLQVTKSVLMDCSTATLEISVQQAAGTFCAQSPRLLRQAPTPQFVYPFVPPADASATVTIRKQPSPQVFNKRLLSANAQFTGVGFGFEDIRVQSLLQWLRLPELRFPGGTVGNFYNWQNDQFYNDTYAASKFKREIDSEFKFAFDSYAKSMVETDATSLLMFNVIEDTPTESANRLRARTPSLVHVDWIEMGNENYDPAQGLGHVNHSGVTPASNYIAVTKHIIEALKEASTAVSVAINLDAETWTPESWNLEFVNETYFDGCVMHPYVRVAATIFNSLTVEQILTANTKMQSYFKQYQSHFGSRPLLLSEWGILGSASGGQGTFIQSLGEASQMLTILNTAAMGDVNITQAGIHILYGGSSTNANALFFLDVNTNKSAATPTGVWYKKLVDSLVGTITTTNVVTGPVLDADTSAVDALAVYSSTGELRVVAVNKLNVSTTLSVDAVDVLETTTFVLESFNEAPLSWMGHSLTVNPWSQQPGTGTNVQLPPLSISVASFNTHTQIRTH